MSQKIDLEQIASFLKDRKKERRKKMKKKKAKRKGKKFKLVVLDGRNVSDSDSRQGMINKLGINQNVTDAKIETSYDKFKKKAEGGSLNLIYALQKDVRDIQSRFMGGAIQAQERPTGLRGIQSLNTRGIQSLNTNASYDSAIEAQRVATENKKNQDRIEKEAKAEVKRLEKEAQAIVKRIEKEAKDEQKRVMKEQALLEKRLQKQAKDDRTLIKTEVLEEVGVVKIKKPNVKKLSKARVIPMTIAQGMRTFTDFMPNPPDIGGGGGLPPLPFNRERDQYDPLEPTPFYRSTADRIEAPVLQEVLDSFSAGGVEGGGSEFPTPDDAEFEYQSIPVLEPLLEEEEEVDGEVQVGGEVEVEGGDIDSSLSLTPAPKKGRGRPKGSKNKSRINKASGQKV